MASNAVKTLTAASKADRKSAEITAFQHRSCAIFGGSLMESRYGFSLKSGVASAEMCEKSAYFQALSMMSPKIRKDMF